MSAVKSGFTAMGRLAALVLLAAAFFFGMAGVVYMSLQGAEVKVPEITGKDFSEGEKELALLGLKIKKRADRVSTEQPNTVIEQLPKPGETVKTGQMILVVTSKASGESGEKPSPIKPEEDDSEKIEEMITEKPKKAKANTNTSRKKADTTRDVTANNSDANSAGTSNSNKAEGGTNNSNEKPDKNPPPPSNARPSNPGVRGGDTRPKPPPHP